jgi:hypothetical protein
MANAAHKTDASVVIWMVPARAPLIFALFQSLVPEKEEPARPTLVVSDHGYSFSCSAFHRFGGTPFASEVRYRETGCITPMKN